MISRTALVLSFAILAACSQGGQEANTGGTSAPATDKAPERVPVALRRVGVGNYIETGTYAVGGQGNSFTAADNLYGVVEFSGIPKGTEIRLAVKDQQGREVTSASRATEADAQTSITFDLQIPTRAQLAPGQYAVEASAPGLPVLPKTIRIR